MTELPEKFPLTSADIAAEKREQLRRCLAAAFPEIMAEDKIDLDQLRRVLGEWVEPDRERFGLTWPGKAACMKVIQAPSVGTLKPCREESVDWDTTENVFIEGDNLEVLKLLQKAYFGKVKMIYIDPPYNTGGEFIYPDKYAENLDTYLTYTRQIDEGGRTFSTNTESSGRFHSRWLSMLYPRLYLAKNLLRHDGVIFVSIDDNEVHNAIALMNDVFGDDNHYATIAWQKKDTPANDAKAMSVTHEYILAYTRSDEFDRNLLPRTDEQLQNYKNPDSDHRGPWIRTSLIRKEVRADRLYEITNPKGHKRTPPPGTSWRLPPETFSILERENCIWWGQDNDGELPFRKRFLSEVQSGVVPVTWWDYRFAGSNRNAKIEIRDLFDKEVPFDTPKPSSLIRQLIKLATAGTGIVMDFFAGSGTTAHAVLDQNKEDGGTRKFLLVQLPEPTERPDYYTIADIAKERVRRVAKQNKPEQDGRLKFESNSVQDLGFRAFKLDQSNFRSWDGSVTDDVQLEAQLELHIHHVATESSAEDILYELLLKDGFPLATPIEKRALAGKEVFSIAGGALLICLDRQLTQDVIDAMADLEPQRVICLDAGFQGNDQLKANAVQTFKARARNRETAIEFRTV